MGKSFRENGDIYDQREKLLARRKGREEKLMMRLWSIHEERTRVDNDKEAKKITSDWIRKLHSSSIRSILFTQAFLTLDEDIAEAMARGTLYEEFPLDDRNDTNKHPIFSRGSQQFMDQVLKHNPELTELYLSPKEDVPLLLEYDPNAGKINRLTEEQMEATRKRALAYLRSLLPPEEVLIAMHQALQVSTGIGERVGELQSHIEDLINRALAESDKKSRGKRSYGPL